MAADPLASVILTKVKGTKPEVRLAMTSVMRPWTWAKVPGVSALQSVICVSSS